MNIAPFQPLETDRLRLRCVVADDAPALTRLITPAVSRWVASWPVPLTPEIALTRIMTALKLAFAGDLLPVAIIEKESAELIGWTEIYRDAKARERGSLGYWLGEKYHGKGYMKELAPVVVVAGFALLNLTVIEAGAQPGNTASFAVMRALGMKRVREEMVYAPARKRDELCYFYEIYRPTAQTI
ncbi:GNAT family N-acetyltransferase [Acidocella sp.]|uniref:GNAT family N-acetyltransferase n=1 Tax=Acidocella sp. TaxID=50710 RepID=UPI0026142403|nr:GNAT family N-acetyltransferase [Acidocella sp.]